MAGQVPANHAAVARTGPLTRAAFTGRFRLTQAGAAGSSDGVNPRVNPRVPRSSAGANGPTAAGSSAGVNGVRASQQANAARRQATEEEEEYLASQEQVQEALLLELGIEAEEVEMEDIDMDFNPAEVEEFNQEKELHEYENAQREAELAAEAERAERADFASNLDLAEAELEADRHRLVEILKEGATWLLDDQAFFHASYAQLTQVQYAAQQLLENVQRGLQMAIEFERAAAQEEISHVRIEAAIAADTTRMQLAAVKDQLNLVKAQQTRLQKSLEKEKDRYNCKICYARPKNCVLLPCLHADYCVTCIAEHKKRRNTCPTCRTPMSGTLECRPAAPDDE